MCDVVSVRLVCVLTTWEHYTRYFAMAMRQNIDYETTLHMYLRGYEQTLEQQH